MKFFWYSLISQNQIKFVSIQPRPTKLAIWLSITIYSFYREQWNQIKPQQIREYLHSSFVRLPNELKKSRDKCPEKICKNWQKKEYFKKSPCILHEKLLKLNKSLIVQIFRKISIFAPIFLRESLENLKNVKWVFNWWSFWNIPKILIFWWSVCYGKMLVFLALDTIAPASTLNRIRRGLSICSCASCSHEFNMDVFSMIECRVFAETFLIKRFFYYLYFSMNAFYHFWVAFSKLYYILDWLKNDWENLGTLVYFLWKIKHMSGAKNWCSTFIGNWF